MEVQVVCACGKLSGREGRSNMDGWMHGSMEKVAEGKNM